MTRDFLTKLGLEKEVIDNIMTEHGKGITGLKSEISNLKAEVITKDNDLQEKDATIQTLNGQIDTLKTFETNYAKVKGDYDTLKADIENKATNEVKAQLINDKLKEVGFNDSIIPLLAKEFDINTLNIAEVEGKKSLENIDNMLAPLKEQYGAFIKQEQTEGNPPANPPAGGGNADDAFLLGFGV